jgi:hypothetical protein
MSTTFLSKFQEMYPNGTKRSFVSMFGLDPEDMEKLWIRTGLYLDCKDRLFWVFHFLKTNDPYDALHATWHVSWQKYHDCVWDSIDTLILRLDTIRFSERLNLSPLVFRTALGNGIDFVDECAYSICDATECPISRPVEQRFQRYLYSGYKKRHTLKYNLVVAVSCDLILHVSGPYRGPMHDLIAIEETTNILDSLEQNVRFKNIIIIIGKNHCRSKICSQCIFHNRG